MVLNGMTRGSPECVMMFQSNVGNGLRPSPLEKPVIAERFTLFGAIQASQLNADSAVNM